MKRRHFLQSSLALASSGLWARSNWAQQQRWDFVIVGAGTAGIPAAIFAARRGASVLLIDAAKEVGGTLHLANGQISAAGTKLQTDKGIVDSPDTHFEDVMRMTQGLADPAVIRDTVDHAPATINWLLDGGLVPLPNHPVTGDAPGRPGYSVPRYLWGANEGRDILKVVGKALEPEIRRGRVVPQLNTRVTGLLTTDSGAVEGVRAEMGSNTLTFEGRHTLLTSGGYAMNPELFEMLVGHPAYKASSYSHSLGDGLQLATSVGGWLRGQRLHRAGTGSILTTDEFGAKSYARFNTTPQQRLPWEIWVNDDGERFIREDEPLVHPRSQALLRQPRLRYAIVFDHAILQEAPLGIPNWSRAQLLEHFDAHPMFASAATLDELATKAKVDPSGLKASVAQYNAGVDRQSDPLGRTHLPRKITKPPFYAIIHLGSSATSSAGVVVDGERRVLRGNGEPIPNLYAAGEVLGSGATLGNAFAPGMMLTPALTLGRMLGERLPI